MTLMSRLTTFSLVLAAGAVAIGAQDAAPKLEPRPKNIPFYTWVREDTFGGFLGGDMVRFERGMAKAQEFLTEDPNNMDALNWLGAGAIYRAVRAFEAGDAAAGDALFRDGMAMMAKAAAAAPANPGVRATSGGTLLNFLSRLPDRHYKAALDMAREQYVALYKAQEPMLDRFPLHLKGEALAGVAETEFRAGDRAKANEYLDKIIAGMPGTRYAQVAETWRKSPEGVTKSDKLACQSCHEPGRLAPWLAKNTQ